MLFLILNRFVTPKNQFNSNRIVRYQKISTPIVYSMSCIITHHHEGVPSTV